MNSLGVVITLRSDMVMYNVRYETFKSEETVWPGMKEAVKTFLRNCPCCQKMSAVKIPVNSYTHTTATYKPMKCRNIDFLKPFPDKGYILVMIDTFIRFVELYATKDATAKATCTAVIEHVGRYGAPRYLSSDNGQHFANHVVDEFTKLAGRVHEKVLAYSSEHNAIVERMSKEVSWHIRAYTYDRANTENYQEILNFIQRIKSTTINDRTKISLAQLLHGNAINMDEGMFIPRGEVTLIPENITISSMTRTPVRAVRVQAYVRFGSRTIRSTRFIA